MRLLRTAYSLLCGSDVIGIKRSECSGTPACPGLHREAHAPGAGKGLGLLNRRSDDVRAFPVRSPQRVIEPRPPGGY